MTEEKYEFRKHKKTENETQKMKQIFMKRTKLKN